MIFLHILMVWLYHILQQKYRTVCETAISLSTIWSHTVSDADAKVTQLAVY